MIHACNANTFASVQMIHPEAERMTLVKRSDQGADSEELLWDLSRGETWGTQRLTVYRSRYLQKLLWYYPKKKHWVILEGYDEQKEDNDVTYAGQITELMSRPASSFVIRRTTCTTTTTTTITTTTVFPTLNDRPKPKKKKEKKVSIDFDASAAAQPLDASGAAEPVAPPLPTRTRSENERISAANAEFARLLEQVDASAAAKPVDSSAATEPVDASAAAELVDASAAANPVHVLDADKTFIHCPI